MFDPMTFFIFKKRFKNLRRAQFSLSTSFDPELGWETLISGGLKIYEIHSGHTELFDEPCVRVTADNLKD